MWAWMDWWVGWVVGWAGWCGKWVWKVYSWWADGWGRGVGGWGDRWTGEFRMYVDGRKSFFLFMGVGVRGTVTLVCLSCKASTEY